MLQYHASTTVYVLYVVLLCCTDCTDGDVIYSSTSNIITGSLLLYIYST